jgi:hypothetical protein
LPRTNVLGGSISSSGAGADWGIIAAAQAPSVQGRSFDGLDLALAQSDRYMEELLGVVG